VLFILIFIESRYAPLDDGSDAMEVDYHSMQREEKRRCGCCHEASFSKGVPYCLCSARIALFEDEQEERRRKKSRKRSK
jgi:hypothetical protein